MDYATLTDNSGKKADFRNIILIMTSNAGASEVGKNKVGFGNRVVGEDNIDKEVSKIFSPEFRNRLDDIIIFNKMDEDMAIRVAKRSLDEFQQKLNKKHIKIKVTDECYKWIASKGLNSNYGAREILRVIQEKIKPYFIDEVLFGNLTKGGETLIDVKDNNIKFESIDK